MGGLEVKCESCLQMTMKEAYRPTAIATVMSEPPSIGCSEMFFQNSFMVELIRVSE
jgi:hypothetical protein